jgi:hypothetical protein
MFSSNLDISLSLSNMKNIDVEFLCKDEIIGNKNPFWCLLQSTTDQLYYDYFRLEKQILKHATNIQFQFYDDGEQVEESSNKAPTTRRKSLTLPFLTTSKSITDIPHQKAVIERMKRLKGTVHTFLSQTRKNRENYIEVLRAYDKRYNTDCEEEELEELERTHIFLNGERLETLIEILDEVLEQLSSKVKDERKISCITEESSFVERDTITEEEKNCMNTFRSLLQKMRMRKMRKSRQERRQSSRLNKRHSALPDQPIPFENLFFDRVSDEESW